MKYLLLVACFSTLTFAERAAREFELKRMGNAIPAEGWRIQATSKGLVIVRKEKGSSRFTLYDRTGAEVGDLLKIDADIASWWVSPDGSAVAWSGGIAGDPGLFSVQVIGAKTGSAPEPFVEDICFSANGKRIAYRSPVKGVARIVARDVATDGWRTEFAGDGIAEGPFWTGDGSSLVAIGGKVVEKDGHFQYSRDVLVACDPTVEKPEWRVLYRSAGGQLSNLATADLGCRLVVLESKSGWKLKLFDLEKGELDVLSENAGTRSAMFLPGGKEVLVTAETKAGRHEVWIYDTERGGTKNTIACDRVELPDDYVRAASASGKDIWLTVSRSGERENEVVRVTPK